MPQVLERLVLQVKRLAASVRDGCTPCGCTDTRVGGTSRAGEGVESRNGLGDKRTLFQVLEEGYHGGAGVLIARLHYDAFQVLRTSRRTLYPSFSFPILSSKKSLCLPADAGSDVMASVSRSVSALTTTVRIFPQGPE